MKKLIFLLPLRLIFTGLVSFGFTTAFASNSLEITKSKIFAPLKGSNATAGYALIKNITNKDVQITLKKVSPFTAVELHETVQKDGRMAMQKVESLKIESGKSIELKQGGNHIMLFDPTKEVKDGDVLKVEFEISGKMESYDFKVIPRN